ncbi:MAG: holo-ACP synthase [Candidatus Omnitrophota bacterium]
MSLRIYSGIDIARVSRIRQAVSLHGSRFLRKIFSPSECRYCANRKNKYQHYAARFAAKEAFIKALSGVTDKIIPMTAIEIGHNRRGRPVICLSEKDRRFLAIPTKSFFELSISHEKEFAVASVLLLCP